MAAFALKHQSGVAIIEAWPTMPKIFRIWSLHRKCADPCFTLRRLELLQPTCHHKGESGTARATAGWLKMKPIQQKAEPRDGEKPSPDDLI